MIYGNKEGIRDSLLAQMEALYDLDLSAEVFAPSELLDVLAAFTGAINREISVYISRSGAVSSPLRVVAPTRVNGLSEILTDLAPGPLSIIISMT